MVGLSRSGGKADKVEEGCDAGHYNIATVSMSSTLDLLIEIERRWAGDDVRVR